MNKASDLYNSFSDALSTRDGVKAHTKACVEVMLTEMEKLVSEYGAHTSTWWAYRLQEIREDLQHI